MYLVIQKYEAGEQECNRLHRATSNRSWNISVPCRLDGTELPWKEFRDNFHLRYMIMPQGITTYCYGCEKNFSVDHALSFPWEGLILEHHNYAAKDLGAFRSQ